MGRVTQGAEAGARDGASGCISERKSPTGAMIISSLLTGTTDAIGGLAARQRAPLAPVQFMIVLRQRVYTQIRRELESYTERQFRRLVVADR